MEQTKQTRAARWKRLWRICGCRRYFFYTILATLLASLFAYLSPLIISFTVDSIVGGKDMNLPGWLQGWIEALGGRDYLAANLWLPALAVLLVQGLNGVCAYFRGRCSALGGEGLAKALRDALYRRLVRAPYAWHKASSTGDLVQRCTSDVETVRRFMQMQMMEVVRTIVMALVALSIMWPINRRLTLIACSLLPLLMLFSFFYSKGVQKLFLTVDESEGAMTTALQENLTGMRVVRTFARQSQELEKFTALNKDYRAKVLRLNNLMGVYWGSSDIMGYLQIALVMLAGIYLAVQGEISQRTEDLVGPYELHDFFLYYVLRWGFGPRKVLRLAEQALGRRYSREVLLKWLKSFYRRFFAQQFKRSCMPDGPKVGSAALSPRGDWRMPSDASARLWLEELEGL